MASFNLTNVFFVCLFVYFKSTHFASAADTLPVSLKTTSHFLKYTFDQGAKCLAVGYDGMEVMKFDPTKPQPESVLFTIRGNTAIVKFTKAMRIFRLEGDGFKPVFSGKQEVKSIDVLYKRACDNYNYLTDGRKLHTYTAKEGILFNKVRTQQVGASEQVIFETIDLMDMAYRVDYNETNPAALVVKTHHVSGLTRTFLKKTLVSWEKGEVTGSTTALKPERVEFVMQSKIPKGVKLEKTSHFLKYNFQEGTKCVGVNHEKRKPVYFDPQKQSLKSVYFSVTGNRLFVNFKDSMDIYKLDNGDYRRVFSGLKKGVSLDIGNKLTTDKYNYSIDDKVHTFTARDEFVFNLVYRMVGFINKREEICTPHYHVDGATKVVFDERSSNCLILTTHHLSGRTRTFKRRSRQGWVESDPEDSTENTTSEKVEFLMKVTPESQGTSPEDDESDDAYYESGKDIEATYFVQSSLHPICGGV